jgi:hypothetical protein
MIGSIPRRRERALAAVVLIVTLLLAIVAIDARARARSVPAQMTRIVATTGLSDLALSSSSRWLRHPSLAEPYAATWDAPIGLDVDPAGAAIQGCP